MALDIVVQCLRRVELFAGLRPLQLAELARRSDRIVYQAGQSIITEGAPADAAVLIVKGECVRTAGPTLSSPADVLPEGVLLAEMGMLIETSHTSTVVAKSVVRAIRLTRAAVLDQIKADPAIASHLSANLARRLSAMAATMETIDRTLADFEKPFEINFPPALVQASAPAAASLH